MYKLTFSRRAFGGTLLAGAVALFGRASVRGGRRLSRGHPHRLDRAGPPQVRPLPQPRAPAEGIREGRRRRRVPDLRRRLGGERRARSGQLDFMYTGNNPALRLAASGADVKAIGLSSWVPQNETLILVPVDSPGADASRI